MERDFIIRRYRSEDVEQMAQLFYDTVHTINAKDYPRNQLKAWANGDIDLDLWDASSRAHYTVVAEKDGKILGFGDLVGGSYLDRMYVHKDHQGQGVGTALCDALEEKATGSVTTHTSLTARTFFENRGYILRKEQQVQKRGMWLTNLVMEKPLGR